MVKRSIADFIFNRKPDTGPGMFRNVPGRFNPVPFGASYKRDFVSHVVREYASQAAEHNVDLILDPNTDHLIEGISASGYNFTTGAALTLVQQEFIYFYLYVLGTRYPIPTLNWGTPHLTLVSAPHSNPFPMNLPVSKGIPVSVRFRNLSGVIVQATIKVQGVYIYSQPNTQMG